MAAAVSTSVMASSREPVDINPAELLYSAVSLVLTDDGFTLPTQPAMKAQKTAEKVLEWSQGNKIPWQHFAQSLVTTLSSCFEDKTSVRRFGRQREKMWGRYHQVRSSQSFLTSWVTFLKALDCEASPIFYQFVTDSLMEELVKVRYPVMLQLGSEDTHVDLDTEECNTIRYVAGYTIRSLMNKLHRSKCKQKEEIKRCLKDMIEDTDDSLHSSTKWTKAVDRGGLIHVDDTVYMVFAEIELVVRRYLKTKKARDQRLTDCIDIIINDENVLFAWSIVSASWQEEEAQALLKMIAEHWITLRGFSFAKSLMELYKRRSKRNVQKSKGIRKQLQGQTSSIVDDSLQD